MAFLLLIPKLMFISKHSIQQYNNMIKRPFQYTINLPSDLFSIYSYIHLRPPLKYELLFCPIKRYNDGMIHRSFIYIHIIFIRIRSLLFYLLNVKWTNPNENLYFLFIETEWNDVTYSYMEMLRWATGNKKVKTEEFLLKGKPVLNFENHLRRVFVYSLYT